MAKPYGALEQTTVTRVGLVEHRLLRALSLVKDQTMTHILNRLIRDHAAAETGGVNSSDSTAENQRVLEEMAFEDPEE